MRPDRDEMLASVRRALVEFVAPEVSSVYGRTELTYAITLLSTLARESEDSVANTVRENAELRRFLRAAGRKLTTDPDVNAGLVADLATVAPPSPRPDLRLSALRTESAGLFDLFIRLQAACEEAPPSNRALANIYRQSLEFLRLRTEAQGGGQRGFGRG